MAARLDVFHFAWVNVLLVALVLIAALAGIVTPSRPRAADLPIGRLWPASVAIRIVLALGVFYLMVAKPESVESLIVMMLALSRWKLSPRRHRPSIRVSSGYAPGGALLACEPPDDCSRDADARRPIRPPGRLPFHAEQIIGVSTSARPGKALRRHIYDA